MKPKNIKEARELVKRYETITLEEIKNMYCDANDLTGFGSIETCTLCIKADYDCSDCIYHKIDKFGFGDTVRCYDDDNAKTYDRIDEADTPVKLRNAFRARAKHIKSILEKFDN